MSDANVYMIYLDRLESVSDDAVRNKMDLCLSWYRLTDRNWIVYTTSDADRLYSRLASLVKDSGSLFICKLDVGERQGWMSKKFWDWLDRHAK